LPAGRSVSLLGFRTMNNMFSGRTTGEACATIRAGRSQRPHKPLASSTVTEYRLDDEDMMRFLLLLICPAVLFGVDIV
jgi:hypothetical protein